MIQMLKKHPKIFGNLMIALLFIGGGILIFNASWNTPESEAMDSCCGGDATTGCCSEVINTSDAAPAQAANCGNCTHALCGSVTNCNCSGRSTAACADKCAGRRNKVNPSSCCNKSFTRVCYNYGTCRGNDKKCR